MLITNSLLMKYLFVILLLFGCSWNSFSQESISITIVEDGDRGAGLFLNLVKSEIDALLSHEFEVQYKILNLKENSGTPESLIEEGLQDDSELLITMGFSASSALRAFDDYPKPCISGLSLQQINGSSTGINNYTFVESPFSIQQDFETFQSIIEYKHLAIFTMASLRTQVEPYLRSLANGFDIQFITISDNPKSDLERLNDEVDAVYMLPNLYDTEEKHQALIDGINDLKLPSFALIGRRDVEKGVLASIAPSDYLSIYARRIALNVMKIMDGQNAKDLPIQIDGIENDFVINVGTMENLELYPPFEVLGKASLINFEPQRGRKYTIQSAIAEALNNNLSYQSSIRNVDIQDTEIGIARSNILPELTANTTLVTLDNNSAEQLKVANQITPQTSWTADLGLSQLIFSQPALANISIQKALLRSEEAGLLAEQLDLVQDVCLSYLNLLQAQANLNIQNANIQTTLSNLNIAKTKARIGTVSNADVYGFESQLAQNKTLLNDARTISEQTRIGFNQLLNRPLDEEFMVEDVRENTDLLFLQDDRISGRVNNHYDFRKFSEFLINYAYEHAPEIEQLEWAIRAQQLSLQSNKLSRFLPQIGVQGNLTKNLGRYGTRTEDEVFEAIGIDPYQATWNVGVNASLPIFQGFLRNKRIQQDKIRVEQLEINRDLLRQSFATNIMVSLENLGNSYNDIQFTREAEEASGEYLKIVQDLYREGAINIVTLLDAQNQALSAQLAAISSQYQFLSDAIIIERLFNNIYLLKSEEERNRFIETYLNYLIKKDNDE